MKKLSECKELFKDLFFNCLDEKGFEKSPLECTERARIEMFCDTLNFIYDQEFKSMCPIWTHEALNEYYS